MKEILIGSLFILLISPLFYNYLKKDQKDLEKFAESLKKGSDIQGEK